MVALASLSVPSVAGAVPASPPIGPASRVVARFDDPATVEPWRPLDDRVMGGRSRSSAVWSPEAALVFAGELSLEQGGGFASLRAEVEPMDLRGTSGLLLVARGDGRDYRLNLRDRALAQRADEGTQFRATFRAEPGGWQRCWLPWSAFAATRRGRLLPGVAPLSLDAIVSVGLMTAFREPGPFRLELRSIEAI